MNKKRIIINAGAALILAISICSCKSVMPDLICVCEEDEDYDDRWGYVNMKGEYVIPPQFDDAMPFGEDGLAMVRLSDRSFGYINKKGQFVIAPEFIHAVPFEGGVAVATRENGAPCVINVSGKVIRELKEAESVQMFTSDGLARMKSSEGKYGFIDKKGKVVIAPEYTFATRFSEGYAIVAREDEPYRIIDVKGKVKATVAVASNQIETVYPFSDGLAALSYYGRGYRISFVDLSGKEVIHPRMFIPWFSEGLASFSVGDEDLEQCGVMDKKGKIVINPMPAVISPFQSGLAMYCIGEESIGYVNKKGEIVIPPQFETGTLFYGEIAAVGVYKEQRGIINKKGEYLIPPRFRNIRLALNQVTTDLDFDWEEDWGEELECKTDYFDHEIVVNSFLDNIAYGSFFGIQPGQEPEILASKEGYERSRRDPMTYISEDEETVSNCASRSRITYTFEKGTGVRPAIFPGETAGQPWPFEGIKNVDLEYSLHSYGYGKSEFLAKKIVEAMGAKGWPAVLDEKKKEYSVNVPYEGSETSKITLGYSSKSLVSTHIEFPKVVKIKILEGSTLPDSYAWLVKGGDWMDNPWGYDSPSFTFSNDKTYKSYEYDDRLGEINKTGRYEIVNDTKLLLRNEDGKLLTMNMDLEDERLSLNGEWLFAMNGTKFDEKMKAQFGPFGSSGSWDYYHTDWPENGIVLKFKTNRNGDPEAVTFYQYPVGNGGQYEPLEDIIVRPAKQTLTLTVKNRNQLVDANNNVVATGNNDWPNSGIIISGKGNDWYLGRYDCQ